MPTDGEIGLYGSAGRDGLWATILEKGYAQWLTKRLESFFDPGPRDPFEEVGSGGQPAAVIRVLTGKEVDVDTLSVTRLSVTRRKLAEALSHGRVVTATIGRGSRPKGLVNHHVYTVLAYDPKTDTVTLRNPWGHTEPTDSVGKTKDGKNDGIFRVKVSELDRHFSSLAYEMP